MTTISVLLITGGEGIQEALESDFAVTSVDDHPQALELDNLMAFDALVLGPDPAGPAHMMASLQSLRTAHVMLPTVALSKPIVPDLYARFQKSGVVRILNEDCDHDELAQAVRYAAECKQVIRGTVHGLSLVDILQMMHYGRRTVSVALHGPLVGHINVQNGEIVHASQGNLTGVAALQRMLAQDAGTIETVPLDSDEQTLALPFEALLLDALRLLDEGQQPGSSVFPSLIPPDTGEEAPSWNELESEGDAFIPILERTVGRYCPSAKALLLRANGELIWLVGHEDALPKILLSAVAERASEALDNWQWLERMTPTAASALLEVGGGDAVAMYMPIAGKAASGRFRMAMLRAHEQLRSLLPPDPPSRRSIEIMVESRKLEHGHAGLNILCQDLVRGELQACAIGCRVWDNSSNRFAGGYVSRRGSTINESAWHLASELVNGTIGRALAELSDSNDNLDSIEILVRAEDFFLFGHALQSPGRAMVVATSRQVNLGMVAVQLRTIAAKQIDEFFASGGGNEPSNAVANL